MCAGETARCGRMLAHVRHGYRYYTPYKCTIHAQAPVHQKIHPCAHSGKRVRVSERAHALEHMRTCSRTCMHANCTHCVRFRECAQCRHTHCTYCCTAQRSTARQPVLHCTALHRTALHCTAPHRTILNCTAPHRTAPHRTALHHTALRCAVLHCIGPVRGNRVGHNTPMGWSWAHKCTCMHASMHARTGVHGTAYVLCFGSGMLG